jgi:hypothetical protein
MSWKMSQSRGDKAYKAFFDFSVDFPLAELFVKAHRGSSEAFVTGHSKGAATAAWLAASLPGVTGIGINGPGIGHHLNDEQKIRLAESGFRMLINRRDLIGPAFLHPEPAIYVDYRPACQHGRKIDGDLSGHNLQTIVFDEAGFAVRVEKPKHAADIEVATRAACRANKNDVNQFGLCQNVTSKVKKILFAALKAQKAAERAAAKKESGDGSESCACLTDRDQDVRITEIAIKDAGTYYGSHEEVTDEWAWIGSQIGGAAEDAIRSIVDSIGTRADGSEAAAWQTLGKQIYRIIHDRHSSMKPAPNRKKAAPVCSGNRKSIRPAIQTFDSDYSKLSVKELRELVYAESKLCENRIYNEVDNRIRSICGKLLTEEEIENLAIDRQLTKEEMNASRMKKALQREREKVGGEWAQWYSDWRLCGFDRFYTRFTPDFMKSSAQKDHEQWRREIEQRDLELRKMEAEHKALQEQLLSRIKDPGFQLRVEQEMEMIRESEKERLAELKQFSAERDKFSKRKAAIDSLLQCLPQDMENMEIFVNGDTGDINNLLAQAEQIRTQLKSAI